MTKFDACHDITAKWEGGWSDHKADPGGKTNWGITQATLSAHLGRPATGDEIRSLTKERAKAIYAAEYWDRVGGDALPPGVDLCVYDFGVNSGPGRAVKSLQAALGVKADGWVGDETRTAAWDANRADLINRLCDRRLAFLRGLGTYNTFGRGWENRVRDIRKQATQMAVGAKPTSAIVPVPNGGTAKAEPAPPVEKTVSTEQKIGGAAAATGGAVVVLGPVAGFWRDNKDVLADPMFLGVAGVLVVVIVILLLRKPKSVEAQS